MFFPCLKQNQYETGGDKSTYGGTAGGRPSGAPTSQVICLTLMVYRGECGMRKKKKQERKGWMSGSKDVRFDSGRDGMIRVQRAGWRMKGS